MQRAVWAQAQGSRNHQKPEGRRPRGLLVVLVSNIKPSHAVSVSLVTLDNCHRKIFVCIDKNHMIMLEFYIQIELVRLLSFCSRSIYSFIIIRQCTIYLGIIRYMWKLFLMAAVCCHQCPLRWSQRVIAGVQIAMI